MTANIAPEVPTPRTDALEQKMDAEGLAHSFRTDYLFSEFRKLERELIERDAVRLHYEARINELKAAHAAALEELARLKAPVEVAGRVAKLRSWAEQITEDDDLEFASGLGYEPLSEIFTSVAAALESQAAQLAERDAEADKP